MVLTDAHSAMALAEEGLTHPVQGRCELGILDGDRRQNMHAFQRRDGSIIYERMGGGPCVRHACREATADLIGLAEHAPLQPASLPGNGANRARVDDRYLHCCPCCVIVDS
jgi:hypothetical protein